MTGTQKKMAQKKTTGLYVKVKRGVAERERQKERERERRKRIEWNLQELNNLSENASTQARREEKEKSLEIMSLYRKIMSEREKERETYQREERKKEKKNLASSRE